MQNNALANALDREELQTAYNAVDYTINTADEERPIEESLDRLMDLRTKLSKLLEVE